MNYAEIETFYQELIRRARSSGITCAITGGMACVHYGVASTTKDCDLLCTPDSAERLFDLLADTRIQNATPIYRGKISPPLDARWLKGGWTSHLLWATEDEGVYLDVFGIAPRGSSPWENSIAGLYAGLHVVGEMKRTDRERDWPVATALGVKMLKAGDLRGWLHLFDAETMSAMMPEFDLPDELISKRPVLELVRTGDDRLRGALHCERMYWHELDRVRLGIYRQALRPYVTAATRTGIPRTQELLVEHELRVRLAEEFLAQNPLQDHGLEKMENGAMNGLLELLGSSLYFEWLPEVKVHFSS